MPDHDHDHDPTPPRQTQTLPLLNAFEVNLEGKVRHLIGLIDPVLAGARGIDGRAVVGEFTPGPDGDFDPNTFLVNPHFIAALEQYMNEKSARFSRFVESGGGSGGGDESDGRLEVLDGRSQRGGGGSETPAEPSATEVLGWFTIDDKGQVVPGSFAYNGNHLWFSPETGASSLLSDRKFYDWLHR
jgi:hypothetical protein